MNDLGYETFFLKIWSDWRAVLALQIRHELSSRFYSLSTVCGDRTVMVAVVCVWIYTYMRVNRAVLSSRPHDDCVTGALKTSNRRINLFTPNCTVHVKSTRNKVVTSVVALVRQVHWVQTLHLLHTYTYVFPLRYCWHRDFFVWLFHRGSITYAG